MDHGRHGYNRGQCADWCELFCAQAPLATLENNSFQINYQHVLRWHSKMYISRDLTTVLFSARKYVAQFIVWVGSWCRLPQVQWCSIAVVQYRSGAVSQWCRLPLVQYRSGADCLRCSGAVVQTASGARVQGCRLPLVQWCRGADCLRCSGLGVQTASGAVVQYRSGADCLSAVVHIASGAVVQTALC